MGCSPIKVVRELGLKRRETVWSLSTVRGMKIESDSLLSTRGLVFVIARDNQWRFSYQKQLRGIPMVVRLSGIWHSRLAMYKK